jgi:glutamate racemase
VGLVGTTGTIQSQSYPLEIAKLFPDIVVTGEACPMWVPLVENSEYNPKSGYRCADRPKRDDQDFSL